MKLLTSTTATPDLKAQLKQRTKVRLSEICLSSHWLCLDCFGLNTREEDDHGQPAHCGVCGSFKLELQQPVC